MKQCSDRRPIGASSPFRERTSAEVTMERPPLDRRRTSGWRSTPTNFSALGFPSLFNTMLLSLRVDQGIETSTESRPTRIGAGRMLSIHAPHARYRRGFSTIRGVTVCSSDYPSRSKALLCNPSIRMLHTQALAAVTRFDLLDGFALCPCHHCPRGDLKR